MYFHFITKVNGLISKKFANLVCKNMRILFQYTFPVNMSRISWILFLYTYKNILFNINNVDFIFVSMFDLAMKLNYAFINYYIAMLIF